MYGTFGKDNNPSTTNYHFKSYPLWEDSEGIYLYRKEVTNDNINLILYGVTETIYTMQATLTNKTHGDLALNTKIY